MVNLNTDKIICDIIDFAEIKMDVYEFAIYMYLARHTRFIGKKYNTFGFKSIRKTMVIGVGESSKPMSEGTCYLKIKSLQIKGFIKILDSVRAGQIIEVLLPHEIADLIPSSIDEPDELVVEKIDFFSTHEYRLKILDREQGKCFYCFKTLSIDGYVIEHVISRPAGDNSYRNLVASCRACNNKKASNSAQDFIRKLYRDNFISEIEFMHVSQNLSKLKNGDLKPTI